MNFFNVIILKFSQLLKNNVKSFRIPTIPIKDKSSIVIVIVVMNVMIVVVIVVTVIVIILVTERKRREDLTQDQDLQVILEEDHTLDQDLPHTPPNHTLETEIEIADVVTRDLDPEAIPEEEITEIETEIEETETVEIVEIRRMREVKILE